MSSSFHHHFIIILSSFHRHFIIIIIIIIIISSSFYHHFIIMSSSFHHHFIMIIIMTIIIMIIIIIIIIITTSSSISSSFHHQFITISSSFYNHFIIITSSSSFSHQIFSIISLIIIIIIIIIHPILFLIHGFRKQLSFGFRVSGVYYLVLWNVLSGSITPFTRFVDLKGDFTGTGTNGFVSPTNPIAILCNHGRVFFSGSTTFTGGKCIDLTWYTIFWVFVLKALTTNLLSQRNVLSGGWHPFCTGFIRGLNCDCALPVAWWKLGALPRSKKLFARHWMNFASLSLSVNASTGISWQSSSVWWLLMKHCSAAASTKYQTWQTLSWQMILRVLLLSGNVYAVPSWNRKRVQKSGMKCLSCWRDDQHPVAENDFG